MSAPFVRSPYNYDTASASSESGLVCDDPSLAQQNFKDECDINVIVRRFGVTGQLPSNVRMPSYGDFTGVTDYQSALNSVLAARDSFMSLPAEVRSRFSNDPALFVDFCSDPANRDEALKLGLIDAPAKPVVPAVATAESPAPSKAQ